MEDSVHYSPYDKSRDEMINISLSDFIHMGVTQYEDGGKYYSNFKFISDYYGENQSFLAEKGYGDNEGKFTIKKYEYSSRNRCCYGYSVGYDYKVTQVHMTLEEIFEKMKPKCIQTYLTNGHKYERRYQLDE